MSEGKELKMYTSLETHSMDTIKVITKLNTCQVKTILLCHLVPTIRTTQGISKFLEICLQDVLNRGHWALMG